MLLCIKIKKIMTLFFGLVFAHYIFSFSANIRLFSVELEISIPSDDPIRLVSAFVEEMDLSELYKTYGRIRKNQVTPRQMLKLVIYAVMNRIYSSRDIQKACKPCCSCPFLLIFQTVLVQQKVIDTHNQHARLIVIRCWRIFGNDNSLEEISRQH